MMLRNLTVPVAILLAGLASLSACQHKDKASKLPIKQYELHGKVVQLDPQSHSAVIKGQEIKGWMSAMTMEYPVKQQTEYQNLQPGEQITATVYVQGMNYWIAGIRRTPEAAQAH